MKSVGLYYRIKPLFPLSLQLSFRRAVAAHRRKVHRHDWPIHPDAARAPESWAGWPEGKKFALVLTHDVETAAGCANCPVLMALEERLGFRSSFNLVPADYPDPVELRARLAGSGFEVRVHGLKQEGMALLNTHPDYMDFDGCPLFPEQYPAEYYASFLEYAEKTSRDSYWHVLPRELSRHWKARTQVKTT